MQFCNQLVILPLGASQIVHFVVRASCSLARDAFFRLCNFEQLVILPLGAFQIVHFVVRASCSLALPSEQDARTTERIFQKLGCSPLPLFPLFPLPPLPPLPLSPLLIYTSDKTFRDGDTGKMTDQSNAFVQINEDDSAFVTTDKGTAYVSDEMNVVLEEVMREVVNSANYIQSLDSRY